MAISLLADANIQGQIAYLVARMRSEHWQVFWDGLDLQYVTFSEVGLRADDPDDLVWQCCQDKNLLLLTDNRNATGPTSLEATIRTKNTTASLPVFTIGNVQRVVHSNTYADQVIGRFFEYLLDLDNMRGTGRLYLPGNATGQTPYSRS